MKKAIYLVYLLIQFVQLSAQQPADSLTGNYYLSAVRETAAGLSLHSDSSFDFFFSYGALDRKGSGKWQAINNEVVLNTTVDKRPDFALTKSSKIENNFSTIKISCRQSFFLPAMYAIIFSGNQQTEPLHNQNGEIRFPRQPVDSILLLFEFAPEKRNSFIIPHSSDNYFEFETEAWILDIFFKNLALKILPNELQGPLPLLKQGTYRFLKQ